MTRFNIRIHNHGDRFELRKINGQTRTIQIGIGLYGQFAQLIAMDEHTPNRVADFAQTERQFLEIGKECGADPVQALLMFLQRRKWRKKNPKFIVQFFLSFDLVQLKLADVHTLM